MLSIIRIKGGARKARSASTAAVAIGAVAVALVGPGAAQAAGRHGPIKGIVPSRQSRNAGGSGGASNLIFHAGGSVLANNTAYAIFWSPSNWGTPIPASYQSLIARYFADVAAATSANATSNVYYAATQYGAGIAGSTATKLGSLSNVVTFGGAYQDTTAITNDCRDRATSVCVSDRQMVQELTAFTTARHLPSGGNNIYFVFTPKGVGSCYSNSSCSFTQFCAYHSNSGGLLYANMPYADTSTAACDSGQHPNNSDADATINVLSHEHNETITDPLGNAWFNSSGYENGDLCAWKFGSSIGSTSYGSYNQLINGNPYELQQEWSNAHSGGSGGCVLTGV